MTFGRSSLADVTAGRDPHLLPAATLPTMETTLATILAELLDRGGQLTIRRAEKESDFQPAPSVWTEDLPPPTAMITAGPEGGPHSLGIFVRTGKVGESLDAEGLEEAIRSLHRQFMQR